MLTSSVLEAFPGGGLQWVEQVSCIQWVSIPILQSRLRCEHGLRLSPMAGITLQAGGYL